ncbi:hypothetical protein UFOVP1475_37 [uncultured Caudovirales phage]|uniref:Uncharacterized protein n=1 Tax=uncultured Caudovirales phage TaxID=2100421 RepID=A0A6J5SM69_9CAUD|nr:hypothetical protein UFOVP1475_37 [uncultured Caudovirales phage]
MAVISTQSITYRLVAGALPGTQLDVFQDEDLKISNNVTGLFDLGVVPADFTRQITVPGTKVNNAFFEHVYDISIDNPFLFATNIKVPCYIDFNGVYLINGYMQLNKVNVFQNKAIDSYEITLYGTLSSFARTCNNTFLTDLTTLTDYNHTSSFANISASWNGGLFGGDIVYPLMDNGQAWKFNSGFNWYGIDENVNPSAGITVQDFKPAIRAKVVWDAIFEYAGYTYSSSFLNESWFQDVYMVCNNALQYPEYEGVDLENLGQIKISAFSGSGQTDKVIPSASVVNFPWYNVQSDPTNVVGTNSSYTITLDHSSSLQGVLSLTGNISGSLVGGPGVALYFTNTGSAYSTYVVLPNINGYYREVLTSKVASGDTGINETLTAETPFISPLLGPGTYYFGIEQDPLSGFYPNYKYTLDPGGTPKSYLQVTKVRQAADGRVMDIAKNMPYGTTGIKLIDFLVGIQRKYHLVIYPDRTKQNHFIVETFNNWYRGGAVKSFDNFIDLDKKIEVIPANNLAPNKVTFGDKLDGDYLSQQFSKLANREFGKSYYVDTTNFFSQGEYKVETTFASTPLSYLEGTGLSGSVGGIGGVITQYSAGTWHFTSAGAQAACSSPIQIEIFTANGMKTTGQVAYYDQYGITPITGYTYFTTGGPIYKINSTTGVLEASSAFCSR